MMAHLAFRRDTSDEQLVVRFAVEVGSPEVLDMLFVLTGADISAVGPGVWNNWKAEVLADLYRRTRAHLTADSSRLDALQRIGKRRLELHGRLAGEADRGWFERQIAALPPAYLESASADKIELELRALRGLKPGEARAAGRYLPDSHTVEFVVCTHEEITPGVFHKLTGALASQGLEILAAEINTLAEGLVLDRFYVLDPDYHGEPPNERIAAVNQALVNSLEGLSGEKPAFRTVWQLDAQSAATSRASDTRIGRQQHIGAVHDSGYLRYQPHGSVVYDRADAV